jgi:hypothetical protein
MLWLGIVTRDRKGNALSSSTGAVGHALVAQLAEHFLGKEEVTGSIPVKGSRAVNSEKRRMERDNKVIIMMQQRVGWRDWLPF